MSSSESNRRTFLITGGSRGLGKALALQASRAGHAVVLVARHRPALEAVVQQIRDEGGTAHAVAADMGDKHAIHRIAHEAATVAGPVDVLIHAASTLGPTPLRTLADTECEDLERVFQVNVVGPFRLTKLVAGAMALRRPGVVVAISSDAAVEAYPTWGPYGLSKAALDHLTRTWAAERPEPADASGAGIRFLAVDPGEMDTAMHAAAMPDADPSTLADPNDVARRILDMVDDPERAPNGARLVAPRWEVRP